MPSKSAASRPPCPVRLLGAITLATASLFNTAAAQVPQVRVEPLWRYDHVNTQVAGQKSEIVAYDDRTDTLWVAGVKGVDVLDRATGTLVAHVGVTQFGAVNSVAIHGGVAALAIESGVDRTLPGVVVFFDTRTRSQRGAPVTVGALPDMLTFTPNGRQVLVANEGTPNVRPTPAGLSEADPVGSVSIVDVLTRTVTTVPITPAIPGYETLRLFPAQGSLPTQPASYSPYDPEPEYIAVDPDGVRAYVSLQEANGIAVLNLQTQAFEKIFNLGLKDFSLPGNEIDPSDRDNKIELRSVPVKGLYQPDTMATYVHQGRTYLVMANEGDARDNGDGDSEDECRGDAGATDIEYVPSSSELARTTFSNVESRRGGPLVKFGAHSFSIRDTEGRIVYDSGSLLDREAIGLNIYDDGRSDNKGVEPEGVALLNVEGRVLAFVGLERTTSSAIAVFDITDPRDVHYVDTIIGDGDRSAEGLTAFRVGSRYFVAAANEVSDTTRLFEVSVFKGRGAPALSR
jgi:DNA-binding beta-propeller fold protein YncE